MVAKNTNAKTNTNTNTDTDAKQAVQPKVVEHSKKMPTVEAMDEQGLKTKSAKIRYLDKQGFTRGEIAKHLGLIYQHVYNVLKKEPKTKVDEPTKAEDVATKTAEPVKA